MLYHEQSNYVYLHMLFDLGCVPDALDVKNHCREELKNESCLLVQDHFLLTFLCFLHQSMHWTFKENMFCVVGARMMGASMVIAAWGRGLMCACVPPPRRIARRLPKTGIKMLVGVLRRAPPRLISKKGTEIFWQTF